MKKFLFGFLTLALVTTSAFADVTVGGLIGELWTPFTMSGPGYGKNYSSSLPVMARTHITAKNEDGTAGAFSRINIKSLSTEYTWVWWKPLDVLRFQLGQNADSDFGINDLVGWSFNEDAADYVATHNYDLGNSFYGGFGKAGFEMQITPMDALAINFGIPLNESGASADKPWKKTNVAVTYKLDGLGRIGVAFSGGRGGYTPLTAAELAKLTGASTVYPESRVTIDTSAIYASFLLTSVENLGVHFGVGYKLPASETGEDSQSGVTYDEKVTYNSPISIGLGVKYGAGDFGIKAKLQFEFLGSIVRDYSKQNDTDPDAPESVTQDIPYSLKFQILPWYNLGVLTAYLNTGIYMRTDYEAPGGGTNLYGISLGWFVNPYIAKTVGGFTLYAGLQLEGSPTPDKAPEATKAGTWKSDISFAVPIGFKYAF